MACLYLWQKQTDATHCSYKNECVTELARQKVQAQDYCIAKSKLRKKGLDLVGGLWAPKAFTVVKIMVRYQVHDQDPLDMRRPGLRHWGAPCQRIAVAPTRVFSRIYGRGGGWRPFFFLLATPESRKGVNKSLAPTRGPRDPNFFGVAGGPLNRGAPCHGTNGTMVNPSLDMRTDIILFAKKHRWYGHAMTRGALLKKNAKSVIFVVLYLSHGLHPMFKIDRDPPQVNQWKQGGGSV
jgi:hypothetical protein